MTSLNEKVKNHSGGKSSQKDRSFVYIMARFAR